MLISESKLKACLDTAGIPYEFFQFKEGKTVPPPYLIYLYPNSNNFGADNTVYLPIRNPRIEYYFDQYNPEEKQRLENSFTESSFFWEQIDMIYLEHPESMWMVIYELS